jgi:integrase
VPLDAYGPEHVSDLQAALRSKPITANRCVALLSHMFTKAGAGGRRGNWRILPPTYPNPCASAERFPENKRERYLTSDELGRVGAALAVEEEGHPYEVAAIRVLMFTGARPSEILTLRRDHLQLAAGVVIQASKTGPRPIALPPDAVRILKALPSIAGNPHVFADRRRPGRHVTRWMLWQSWKRVRQAAGCADVHAYDVRHTFASVALAGGSSLEFIGGLLGHAKSETTKRYAHLAAAAAPMRKVGAKAAREIAQALSRRR